MIPENNTPAEHFAEREEETWDHEQPIQSRIELQPELSLMSAVLEDTVASFQKQVSARDRRGRRIFREAEDWILDNRNDEIFSFVSICEHLGINPKYFRQGLLRWKQKNLAEQDSERPARPAQDAFYPTTKATSATESEETREQAKAKPEREEEPSALTLYLQEVANIPRLGHERESDLIKQMREGQEKVNEEVLSSPTALRYALALIEKVRKGEPSELQGIMEAEGEIRRRALLTNARVVRRLAAAHDRIVTKLKQPSLPRPRQESLKKSLLKINTDILKTLKNLQLSETSIDEIAARLKKALASLTGLEKKAQALPSSERSSILSEIRSVEGDLELPVEEIKRRAGSILESEAQVRSAKNALIDAHLSLVVRIARKYTRLGVPLLDLIQDGNMGLLRAAEKFDPRLGLRFSTYAWWWIRQFVRQSALESARIIRIPTSVMIQWRKFGQTRRALLGKLGREPTLREIAAELGKPIEEILRITATMTRPVSLETPVGEESELGHFFENRRSPKPFEAAMVEEVRTHVASALAALPAREGAVLRARFGIGEARRQTLEEIASQYSITRERVRQIEHRALERLRVTAQKAAVRQT
jgi:RNA polymerase primary sigma factor